MSYCIQFEIGTKTVKILNFNKISQASEQITIDLSERRELESRRIREIRTESAMSPSRKEYEFPNESNEKHFYEVVDLGYGNRFHLLANEHLLQMNVFEKKMLVECDIFYRDAKKCFSPLRISLHDWRKSKTILDRRYMKEKLKFNRIT